jgi:prepilin-type N-terminal cleavage/methylation domain-containing protein
MRPPQRSRGVTLIEIMVALVIMSILIAMAVPGFTEWIRNQRIRTAAESILNGLQAARAEALKTNLPVTVQIGSGAWIVTRLPEAVPVAGDGSGGGGSGGDGSGGDGSGGDGSGGDGSGGDGSGGDGSGGDGSGDSGSEAVLPIALQSGQWSQANIEPDSATFTFNGFGQTTSATTASVKIYGTDGVDKCATQTDQGKTRCLRIDVYGGGGIRMCDPALPGTDGRGCKS